MVLNGKPTRNADYRHAQSIGRQRQAEQRAAAEVSPEDLTEVLPHDASPLLPDAAPVTTSADETPAAMPRPSWRDREPAIVHRVKWRDSDHHEHLHIVRGDDLDEVLGHLKKVKAVIAAARSRDGAGDPAPVAGELPQCRQVPSARHRSADEPDSPCDSREAAPYCHEHDTRFFRNVWRTGGCRGATARRMAAGFVATRARRCPVRQLGMGRQAPLQKGLIMWYALLLLMMVIVTALPSAADLYIYRDAAGQRVLSNQLPPPGAEVESQREATPAGSDFASPSAPLTAPRRGPAILRSAPERLPSYVDLHPLELRGSGVEDSTVYWKKFVTGVVNNRSGTTIATRVRVRTACTLGGRPADTGSAYLGTIGPRGSRAFQIPILLTVPHPVHDRKFTPRLGPVSCRTSVTYNAP